MKFKTEKEKWAWFGGFVDGEGCLVLVYHPKKKYPHSERKKAHWDIRLVIVNTSKEVMEFLKDNFGGYYYMRREKNFEWDNRRRGYQWIRTGKDLEKLLPYIYKYSLLKREHVKLLIRSLKTKNDKVLFKIKNKIHILNKRGKRDKTQ